MTAIRDEFVIRRNIERYRELLKTVADEPQRAVILRLLGEESLKLAIAEDAEESDGRSRTPLQADAPADDPLPGLLPDAAALNRVK